MSDKQFEQWIKKLASDPDENFYFQVLAYENEPHLSDIKRAADILKLPLEEYVYMRHDGNKDNPIRTRKRVPVGYVPVRRLQQILSKKNSYSLNIDKRNMKTGQVTGEDKIARISDAENYALSTLEADYGLQEFFGPRADNAKAKMQMYKQIANEGYVQLESLERNIEDSQTINTVDVYFTGAGILTDLITPGYYFARTLKEKEVRQRQYTKYEKDN